MKRPGRCGLLSALLPALVLVLPASAALPDPAQCARSVQRVQAEAAELVALEPLRLLAALVCQADGLQQAEARRQQAQARVEQARAAGLPQLQAQARGERATGQPGESAGGLQASWTLLDFGANAAVVQAARQGVTQGLQDQDQALLAALELAARRLADVVAAQGRLEAAGTSLQAAAQAERVAAARSRTGAGTPVDAAQAQRLLAQARLEFVQAQAQRRQANLVLASALGLPPESVPRLALAGALREARERAEQPLPLSAEAAAAQHPLALAAAARSTQRELALQAISAERFGQVQLQARSGRTRSGPLELQDQGLSLEWRVPLFDGGLRRGRAGEARAALAETRADGSELQRLLALNIRRAAAELQASAEALDAAQQLRESAEQGWRLVEERWRRGVGSHLDLQSAQESAAQARLIAADAQARLLLARWLLATAGADPLALASLWPNAGS